MRRWPDLLLAALLTAPLSIAARLPVAGPLRLQLNLGPGDASYVTGFSAFSEVENAVGLHWSGPEGRISLPLEVEGPLRLSLRGSRILPQAADVAIVFGGRLVERFKCRGGAMFERSAEVNATAWTPAGAALHVSPADDQGRALRLDWLRFDLDKSARVRPRGMALFRPALLVLVLFVVLRCAGFGAAAAAALTGPWLALGLLLLRSDPWLTHRLLSWLPEALLLLGVALIVACRVLERRRLLWAGDTRLLVAVATTAFVLRAGALNHPDYWYPDLYSHALLAEVVRDAGWDFFRQPASYIEVWGIGVHEVYGRSLAVPYTPTFHLPFALLPIDRESIITLMRLFAVALCSVPMLTLAVLARQLGASLLCVVLLPLVSVYGVRLALALLPALFGHAVDTLFLAWFGRRFRELDSPRMFLVGVLLVVSCCLAYVSAVVILPAFLALVSLMLLLEGRAGRFRLVGRVLGIGALGGLLAFLLYYRSFSEFIGATLVRLVLGGASGPGPLAQPLLEVLRTRILTFFPPLLALLALLGLWSLLRRQPDSRVFLGAWAAGYFMLLLARARFPDVFNHVHEELFAAPLFCLTAGDTLYRLARAGGWRRLMAWVALGVVAAQGLSAQWRAFVEQFGFAL